MDRITHTLFASDLKPTAKDKLNPSLSDTKLTKDQVAAAWSILYIRPDGKRFFLKNSEPVKKVYNRFDLLKKDSDNDSDNLSREFV